MPTDLQPSAAPIAIIGMGTIFPGRGDCLGFWRDIFEGRDLLSPVPASHWLKEDYFDRSPDCVDKTYGQRGGFISPVAFDSVAFGIPPNQIETTDTAQLLALMVAKAALDDIERDSDFKVNRDRTSVILGVASATELTAHMAGRLQRPVWIDAMREAGLAERDVQDIADKMSRRYVEWRESTFPGLLGNVVAGRIANRLDLHGSNYVTDAACASSLSALQIALHELRAGDSDMVLAGGVDALNDILMFMCFSKTPALSPTGDCRPFSNKADGTMLGEGVGILALRRLDDAERDGNNILAVIRGLGGASDGKGTAIYTPLPEGQARAIKRAYEQAGYGPDAIDLIEAHGTGTKAGDKAEIEGLHLVYGTHANASPWCAIGSVKSQIGHAKAGAGVASLVKTVQALSRKVLPPTLKVEEPTDAIQGSDCFYLNTEPRPWISADSRPRRAAVSSFGFGGSNFHVTLEEYRGPNVRSPERVFPTELFLFSAGTLNGLKEQMTAIQGDDIPEDAFAAWATGTWGLFDASANYRAAITARHCDDLHEKAAHIKAALEAPDPSAVKLGKGMSLGIGPPCEGKIAFLFSGQGSQYVGMGAGLAMSFPSARAVWDQLASEEDLGELALHKIAFPPSAFDQIEYGQQDANLKRMEHTQPAIGAVALAQLTLLQKLGLTADMAAGHSFGEVMALHYGGAMDSVSTIRAAAARGRLMAEAAGKTEGAMIAVQTNAETIRPLVASIGGGLVLANDNGPDQVALSGPVEAVLAAQQACETQGLKVRRLPVASAFHSSIVAAAVPLFETALTELPLKAPRLAVYANATGQPYKRRKTHIATELANQIASPVLFRDMVEAMYADGARIFVEVGPGSVVSGLVRNILADRSSVIVSLDHQRADDTTHFFQSLGELSTCGLQLNMASLFAEAPAPKPKPTPSRHAVMISGANYNKPYPPKGGAAARFKPNLNTPVAASSSPIHAPATLRTHHMTKPVINGSGFPAAATAASLQTTQAIPGTLSQLVWEEASARHADYLSHLSTAHANFMSMATAVLSGSDLNSPVQMQILPTPTPPTVRDAPAPASPQFAPQPAPQPEAASTVRQTSTSSRPVADPSTPETAAATNTGISTDAVRELISEKTGYPTEMLEQDMDLEGELGVDSIKQVEILSAIQDRYPDLPEVDPETLIELRTIRNIVDFFA